MIGYGYTRLSVACAKGCAEVVELLLEQPTIDVNKGNSKLRSRIFTREVNVIINKGNSKLRSRIFTREVNVIMIVFGWTLLYIGRKGGYAKIVEKLVT